MHRTMAIISFYRGTLNRIIQYKTPVFESNGHMELLHETKIVIIHRYLQPR